MHLPWAREQLCVFLCDYENGAHHPDYTKPFDVVGLCRQHHVDIHHHIWWGVSVEDKKYGLPRIAHLQAAPAAIRFLSIEPLLEDLGEFNISGIDWAIVGGESGHGARIMRSEWVERIHEICNGAGVAFFFKQWGGVHKSKTGRALHGRTYDDMPERRVAPIPHKRDRLLAAKARRNWAVRWQTAELISLQPAIAM